MAFVTEQEIAMMVEREKLNADALLVKFGRKHGMIPCVFHTQKYLNILNCLIV